MKDRRQEDPDGEQRERDHLDLRELREPRVVLEDSALRGLLRDSVALQIPDGYPLRGGGGDSAEAEDRQHVRGNVGDRAVVPRLRAENPERDVREHNNTQPDAPMT